MWLLLAVAGTGYLARCWQKARKCKSGLNALKHNTAICSTNTSQRSSHKRSQSAKSRKILPGRIGGSLARNCAIDCDEDSRSPDFLFEEFLHGDVVESTGQCRTPASKDQDAFDQVPTHPQVNISHANNEEEPYLSLSSVCTQNQWGETASRMEQPILFAADIDSKEPVAAKEPLFCVCALSNNTPTFETLHGRSAATTLDFVKSQLSTVASSSGNRLDGSEPVENSFILTNIKSHASPSCLQIPRIKTRESNTQSCVYESKGSAEQAFGCFAKMAGELGESTYSTFTSKFLNRMRRRSFRKPGLLQNPHKVSVGQRYGSLSKEFPEKMQMDKHVISSSCILHSHLLKALLDPEYLDECPKCNYLTVSIRNNNFQKPAPCSTHNVGLRMESDRGTIQKSDTKCISNGWKHSKGLATVFTKPPNPTTNHALGYNESSLFALGVAMGVAFVANDRSIEFEGLHKLLNKTNLHIEELKKQIDSKFEFDLVKLTKAKKHNESMPSKPTMPEVTRSWKAHQLSESNPGKEFSPLELFSADNNPAVDLLSDNTVHGLNELEAELEAELQLMERNVCNTNLDDYEWKQTQCNQEMWQHEGGLYVDIGIQDSTAVQNAEQLYESDFVVPPLELERRLWQVLEQRREERICELENDLHITNEKVAAKELEVQWWKDRVWWLMETSLGGKNDSTLPLLLE